MTGFTITPHTRTLHMASDGTDQPVTCPPGVATEVSERQAVHSIGRPDLKVGLPVGYAARLAACNAPPAPSRWASMTVAELDAHAAELGLDDWGGNKAAKVARLTDL